MNHPFPAQVFKRVDDRFAATAADLLDVCRLATVPKDDEAPRACAALIAARCGDAGLDVQVLLDGAVVVARTKELHAGKPSVLVASDFAVAAPQGWAAPDPFGAAQIVDDAVVAPGAKATKAGAVAAVAAVDAVLRGLPNDDQKPKLNVELLWTCAHGPGDLDAQLKAALQASADAGRPTPDYVYADGPGCDALPGAFAAQFSCRGSLRLDVASSAASPPTNASCVDGNAALCAALAALRDGDGALAVPGLVGFAAKNRFTEALAQHTTASQPEAALAGLPRGPPLPGWTLLEHLCFHPGVTVEALRDGGATVHAHLPPGFEPKAAVEALTSKLALTVDAQPGAAKGFLSDVRARAGTTARPRPLLFPLVSADVSTSDHLSDRSRRVSVFFFRPETLKRRRFTLVPPRSRRSSSPRSSPPPTRSSRAAARPSPRRRPTSPSPRPSPPTSPRPRPTPAASTPPTPSSASTANARTSRTSRAPSRPSSRCSSPSRASPSTPSTSTRPPSSPAPRTTPASSPRRRRRRPSP